MIYTLSTCIVELRLDWSDVKLLKIIPLPLCYVPVDSGISCAAAGGDECSRLLAVLLALCVLTQGFTSARKPSQMCAGVHFHFCAT